MNIKDKTLLYAYFLNNRTLLEQDYDKYHSYVRCSDFDLIFLLELLIARVRHDTFCEVSKNIMDLLNLSDEEGEKIIEKWSKK